MEFWSTLCDEEIFLMELAEDAAASGQAPERANQRFVSQAPGGAALGAEKSSSHGATT